MDYWWEEAACKDEDPELFFPEKKRGAHRKDFRDVPTVVYMFCAKCPVRTECLDDAMKYATLDPHVTTYGIWGGTTETMRRQILKLHQKSSLRQPNNSQSSMN